MWQFFDHAGLGRPGTLGFPGEAVGSMPYPEQMDDLRLSTVSYGYGLSVSPLQLAESYTSFYRRLSRACLAVDVASGSAVL